MKRKHIHLKGDGAKYGHWWFELGDPSDPDSESYGWWPECEPGIVRTFAGMAGELNGQTNFEGAPMRDPYHGKEGDEEFHPLVADADFRTNVQIAECLRRFAQLFVGEWRWTFGSGMNCHTFQEAAMRQCGLHKRAPRRWI